MELLTRRLVLRHWIPADRAPFAALNADPVVMEHFAGTLTASESDGFARWIEEALARNGYGLWAVEVRAGPPFIGFVGLSKPSFDAHFTPAVEVGWRLAREHWGNGYATEAAAEALRCGFEDVGLDEIVSFTIPRNRRSRRVMERIGMTHDDADDFDHPRFPDDDRLRRHVLYRIDRGRWEQVHGADGQPAEVPR